METLREVLLRRLTPITNEDGDIIYPGDVDIKQRTGSNLNQLLKYVFDDSGDKPIDTDLFREYLLNVMKVPLYLLNYKPVQWKRIKLNK